MCGIAGLTTRTRRLDLGLLRGLHQCLEHRGPDDRGFLLQIGQHVHTGRECVGFESHADAALIHQRLAIIDLAPTGWQPMSTPDGRFYLVYNGEIYNYLELRRVLEAGGHQFRSTSDTEVLLHAYAAWGTAAFSQLVGMFALAILDVVQRKLLLARDFFGIKPLYYARWRDGFAFASEISGLLELPGVSRKVNPGRLYDYLAHGLTDHGPESLIQEVHQLPPAHWLEVTLDEDSVPPPVCYWRLDVSTRAELSPHDAALHLRELFMDSIRLHLRSDVPVGVALSGGLDSSSIALAVRALQGPSQELHTFSYVADDPRLSEERWVDEAGAAAGAIVHKVRPRASELAVDVDRLTAIQDEPFGSTSIYAQYRVFQRAGEAGLKVMLDGQGADELLAGYRSHLAIRLASLVRQGRWAEAEAFFTRAACCPGGGHRWLALRAAAQFVPTVLQAPARRLVGRDVLPSWLNAAWFRDRCVKAAPVLDGSTRTLHDVLRSAISTTSLPGLLRYEDRNSMAFSIESRVPFLTPALANFVLSLPEEYLIAPDGTTKAVFRQAMRGIVPDVILDRRDKIGFETTEHTWLTGLRPWVDETLASVDPACVPVLDMGVIQREWRALLGGVRIVRSVDSPVWRWINLIRWSQHLDVAFD